MYIKNITITDFKSIYGTHTIDFDNLKGLVKLSGVIGSGKTTLGEAILYGLFGNVKGQTNNGLTSWGTEKLHTTQVDINLNSNNHDIFISRKINQPLDVLIDNKPLAASNKRNAQEILEAEYYDVPRLAIERMCIISFNQFKSLASMNPNDTKIFLDEIFGFKTFTEYNNAIVEERKDKTIEQTKLQAMFDDACTNIEYFKQQKELKQQELANQIDIDAVNKKINELNDEMNSIIDDVNKKKEEKVQSEQEWQDRIKSTDSKIQEQQLKINEYKILGKQEKEWYLKFQSGKCPTCGQDIDPDLIKEHKSKMDEYVVLINECNDRISSFNNEKIEWQKHIDDITSKFNEYRTERLNSYNELKNKVNIYNSDVVKYNASLAVINQNYDQMIEDYTEKRDENEKLLNDALIEIGQWNEMNDLFSKTLRYKLLGSLIPQINKSIRGYINKFELPYSVEFDQEFKSHISAFDLQNEISYSNLSTGQKKTLDIAIILGILQNIISTVDFNILFCDELFSNMDINSRNVMLDVLKQSNANDRTIFIINHAEMPDDAFSHKVRVTLNQKKIQDKKGNPLIVRGSSYEIAF